MMPRKILITGGAGYIGGTVVHQLAEDGADLRVVDDLRNGNAQIANIAPLLEADIGAVEILADWLGSWRPEVVMHFAAEADVARSMEDPALFFEENVGKAARLLRWLHREGVRKWIFSSTAAVYGEPKRTPMDEGHSLVPVNPYGESKLVFERLLQWYHNAGHLDFITFRYFNAAGAIAGWGEQHEPEHHLVPRIILNVLAGNPEIGIFGTDYPTRDGSAVRDFVHVADIAGAHRLAVEAVGNIESASINLGTGSGATVLEVVETVEDRMDVDLKTINEPRRPGDPAALVASNARAKQLLGWEPIQSGLNEIVDSAVQWHSDRS